MAKTEEAEDWSRNLKDRVAENTQLEWPAKRKSNFKKWEQFKRPQGQHKEYQHHRGTRKRKIEKKGLKTYL